MQVAAVNTPVTPGQVLGAILATGVSDTASRILLAQSAFETGGWKGGLWSYNLGNITTASGDYQILPGNALHFKAYGNLEDGAADYVAFLARRGLVTIADTGDLTAYVQRLKETNYAGADTGSTYATYQAGMASWMNRLANVQPEGGSLLAGFVIGPHAAWWSYALAAGVLAGAWWTTREVRAGRLRIRL